MRSLGNPAVLSLAILALQFCQIHGVYVPLREYAGSTFFDGWDYYGNVDNTTWGNVTFLNQADAVSNQLTYVNSANHAVIKVDNTTNIAPAPLVHRNSIRLTTKDSYGVGTLWIIDAVHLPFGCSVWPSFWTLGANVLWPNGGEIDIIEGINLQNHNQVALHTTPGCSVAPNAPQRQSGPVLAGDCSIPRGCIVGETKPNSFGQGFANAGGGVWALQMDISGIFVWYWSRPDIPASIQTATSTSNMDTSTFGMPTASYPASTCNITQFFAPQQLVLLTTLCGDWAGVPSIYSSTCPGACVDNVIGSGANFADAYFEIAYLRTYIAQDLAASQPPSTISSSSGTGTGTGTGPGTGPVVTTKTVVTVTTTHTGTGGLNGVPTSGGRRAGGGWGGAGAFGLALTLGWMTIVRYWD